MQFKSMACLLVVLMMMPSAWADTVEVTPAQDLTVRRNERNRDPGTEGGIHPKRIDEREARPLDRFAMIRFNSEQFGRDVRAAAFSIHARGDADGFGDGHFRFRLYGVRDGDPQDEAFTEGTYNPAADDTVFQDSRNMLDRRQVVVLGSFTADRGEQVNVSTPQLLAFIQQDTNGIVTLIIIRETDSGQNTTFDPRTSNNPPMLRLVVPDAAAE